MKQYFKHEGLVPSFADLPGLVALIVLLVLAPRGHVHCDDKAQVQSAASMTAWSGSASVDSAKGSCLHLNVSYEDFAVAMSMIHGTAGTADFPGFSGKALDDLTIGLNFDSPWLVAGDLGPAGLGSFIFRPAGAGPLLPLYGRKPLQAERPDGARYRGLVLGNEGGLLAVSSLSDPGRFTSGAWFSPPSSPISALILAGSEPGKISDDWYEPGRVQTDRLWGAASLGLTSKGKLHRLSLAGALAASAGLPGADAMAGRLEAMLAIKRLRLEAEASMASKGWRSPDGVTAALVRLDFSALYRRRGLELLGAYRLVHKDTTDEGPETGLRAHVRLAKGKRELKLATSLSQAVGQSLPVISLDTRCKPGFLPVVLPGLTIETSWKAKDGLSERFDAGLGLRGGKTLHWSMDAGLRYDSLGRHLKGAAAILVPLGGSSLRFGLKSDGWIPLAGEQADAPLVLSVTCIFSGP